MKKIIALLLSCMMVVGLFAGCGQTDAGKETTPAAQQGGEETTPAAQGGEETTAAPAEATPITLSVWAPQEDQVDSNSWLPQVLKKFEEAHPEYKITWETGVCGEGDAGNTVKQDALLLLTFICLPTTSWVL